MGTYAFIGSSDLDTTGLQDVIRGQDYEQISIGRDDIYIADKGGELIIFYPRAIEDEIVEADDLEQMTNLLGVPVKTICLFKPSRGQASWDLFRHLIGEVMTRCNCVLHEELSCRFWVLENLPERFNCGL